MRVNFNVNNYFMQFKGKSSKVQNNVSASVPFKNVEAQSLDAAASYGRAALNVSFKGTEEEYRAAFGTDNGFDMGSFEDSLIETGLQPKTLRHVKGALGRKKYEEFCKFLDKTDYLTYAEKSAHYDDLGNERRPKAFKAMAENFLNSPVFAHNLVQYANEEDFDEDEKREFIFGILTNVTGETMPFATRLCTDENIGFPKKRIADFIRVTNKDNLPLAQKMCTDKELGFMSSLNMLDMSIVILSRTNKGNLPLALKLCTDKNLGFSKTEAFNIISATDKENLALATKLCTDKKSDFSTDEIVEVVYYTHTDNMPLATRLCTDKKLDFPKDKIPEILRHTTKDNLSLATKLCTDTKQGFSPDEIKDIISRTHKENEPLARRLCTDDNLGFTPNEISKILHYTRKETLPLATKLCTDSELNFPKSSIVQILILTNEDMAPYVMSRLDDVKSGKMSPQSLLDMLRIIG